ncbi:MAG: TRAP transporter small permease [Hyphomicrobiaceae bacterium]|nr:TRAP transporter small permease [Hyphomicrobiaceae bacterium]
MDKVLRLWWQVIAVLGRLERAAGIALIVLIVIMISAQVVSRYAFNRPIVWVEDVATFAFIWATFLGAAVGLKELRHIKIETFLSRTSPAAQSLIQAGLYAVILVSCAAIAAFALGVMETEARSQTISLPINLPRHWFYSVPLFVGLCSMAFTAAYFLTAHLVHAATTRTVDAVKAAEMRRLREMDLDEAEVRIAEGSL